jgi:hypothetical protein
MHHDVNHVEEESSEFRGVGVKKGDGVLSETSRGLLALYDQ